MREFLKAKIAAGRKAIAAIESNLGALSGRTRLPETMDDKSDDLNMKKKLLSSEIKAYEYILEYIDGSANRKKYGRPGIRSNDWNIVLEFINDQRSTPVSIDRLMAFIIANDLKLSRQSLRAQLSAYARRGDLERVAEGSYRSSKAINY